MLHDGDSLVCCYDEHCVSVLTVDKAGREREGDTKIFSFLSSVFYYLFFRNEKKEPSLFLLTHLRTWAYNINIDYSSSFSPDIKNKKKNKGYN
jgi:hypothetical protein